MENLVGILSLVVSFFWARAKGFNGFAWMFAGGLIGWIPLALLMPAKGPKCPPELCKVRRSRANIIGMCISGFALLFLVVRLAG